MLGAVTLIALALPGQGALTDWWRDSIAPWFETVPLAPAVPPARRRLVRRVGPRQAARLRLGPDARWGSRSPTSGFLGAFEVLDLTLVGAERGGGRIGRF